MENLDDIDYGINPRTGKPDIDAVLVKQHEVSMVDEILSTSQGRAMMKCVEERDELRNLLDIAHRIISEGQRASLSDIQAFAEGYIRDLEKR